MWEGKWALLRKQKDPEAGPQIGGGARRTGKKGLLGERGKQRSVAFFSLAKKRPKKNAGRIKNQNLVEIHAVAWISTKMNGF